ncbi:MAG: aminopeptidase [Caulobacter sp.]|nr:aminopeptidase [Caulobacter sp.]
MGRGKAEGRESMLAQVAGFEFRYQLRQPLFWIVAIVFFLLTFASVTVQNLRVGDLGPSDHRNGPFAIANVCLIWSVFYMFVTTAFVANIIVRDEETGYGPILRSTRIGKFDYLYGRFIGAFGAVAASFLAVPLGFLLGGFAPWLSADTVGPPAFAALAHGFFVLALPNLLLTSAIFFSLATVTRSLMWTYVGVIAVMVIYTVSGIVLDKPEYAEASALYEPFGTAAYSLVTKYWTPSERNSLVPAVEGAMLFNRLMVLAISAAFLSLAFFLFRFTTATPPAKARKQAALEEAAAPVGVVVGPLAPRPAPRFDAFTGWTQMIARTRLDMTQVFGSPAYVVLLVLGLLNAVGGLWYTTQDTPYGGVIHPVTRVLIDPLIGSFGIIPVIIAVFYAGELVWRERDRRTHEIIESTPTSDWTFVAPKVAAIALVMISTVAVSVLAAMLIQTALGYTHYEPGKYLLWYMAPLTVEWTLLAVLAVFLQLVTPHKFWTWGLMLLLIVSRWALPRVGWEDHLYHYGLASDVRLSDMNNMGRFWIGAWAFRLYWTAFAALLVVLSYGLWRRGTESRLAPRLRRLPRRMLSGAGVAAGLALTAFVCLGVWIFINTHVWNEYRSSTDNEKWQADFERSVIDVYADKPEPTITAVTLKVELEPHKPRMVTRGTYEIENRTGQPIKEVHILADRDTKLLAVNLGEGRWLAPLPRFNLRVFSFYVPMEPGEKRLMSFVTEVSQRGFRNSGNLTSVVDNGTFINNAVFAPMLGVDRNDRLTDRDARKRQKLTPLDVHMPLLGTAGARAYNFLRHDSDWVSTDITITTDADQTPMAPGEQVSDTLQGGRRTARFVSERPILDFFSVQSARYAVKRETYKGVQLAVYYDPQHAWNIDRMLSAQKLSLDYAQANFSPYPFHQLRYLEFPDYARFAQSFAGTVPWSEGLFFIADYRNPDKIDMITYVGAHEVGHQWWAHQLLGADEQGSAALSETLAQYTALMVMKHAYGPDMVRKFLKFELDRYLRGRGTDLIGEQSLNRVEREDYIYYRKGSLVMYRLSEDLGEDWINRALRRLLTRFAYKGAPYPTSLDLMAELKLGATDEQKRLINDLFDRITLYDLKTTGMTSKKRADGRYDVTLTVEARKVYADAKGKETPSPLSETMDVGLFTAEPGKAGFNASKVLALERRAIHSGRQTLTFITAKAPVIGGVDPYNVVIDRNPDDNLFTPK